MSKSIYRVIARALDSWELRDMDVTDISLSRDEDGPLYATVIGTKPFTIEATRNFGLPLRLTWRVEVWPDGRVVLNRVKKEYGPDEDGNIREERWRERWGG